MEIIGKGRDSRSYNLQGGFGNILTEKAEAAQSNGRNLHNGKEYFWKFVEKQ